MEKSNSNAGSSFRWDILGPDLTELILSYLPIPSILRASSVCTQWNSIIHSDSFRVSSSRTQPWFFLSDNNQLLFAFDPQLNHWIRLPSSIPPCNCPVVASTGFFFITCSSSGKFSFKPILGRNWQQTNNLSLSRRYPLISAYDEPVRFIFAGGTLADNDYDDCLAMEIYNVKHDSWETCTPLPEIFRPGSSMQALSSAVHKGKFYVLTTCWGFLSSFDLEKRCWSTVRKVKPPGAMLTYLISCQDLLVLAGLCCLNGTPEFNLWRIDEETLEFSEIGIMPEELLFTFIGTESYLKFESLKCAGWGNLVYVINARNCEARVCEIGNFPGKCSWRKIPSWPGTVIKFQGISSFCSSISLRDFLMKQTSWSSSCQED